MRPITRGLPGRAKRRFVDDLRADPYLVYILGLAVVLTGFWFWHRVPNFATRDERLRLLDPMRAVGIVVGDPSLESLLRAMTDGRELGATFYLYGVVLLPVFAAAFLTGQLDAFAALPNYSGAWETWTRTPRWIWTWSILLGRLVVIAFAVGCVYVTYRIGTEMHDRAAGRLAAVLLSFTWGFLILAHEVGEDVPALFFFLLVVYLGLRYARTGDETLFLAGCVCGGIAIAIKLTTVVCIVLIGVAYLLHVRSAGAEWRDALVRPRLLAVGAALGAATIYVGFPSVIFGGLEPLAGRIAGGTSGKTEPHGWRIQPTWWWFLRAYLNGLGLPLFVAAVGALVASVPFRRRRSAEGDGIIMTLVTVGTYGLLYADWAYIRTHHLLPTIPLLVVVLAVLLTHAREYSPTIARPFVAALLVSSALYAGVGDLGYATQPRDEATEWLRTNAPANATVETYPEDPQETAIPHGMRVYRRGNKAATGGRNQSVGEWMRSVPERCPDYIQLNYYEAILHLAPDEWSERARRLSGTQRRQYVESLLAEDTYPYRVAATFGPRPPFLDSQPRSAGLPELLRVGLVPRTIQYGDPQDVGIDQYTVILARSGQCERSNEATLPSAIRTPTTRTPADRIAPAPPDYNT